MNFDIQDMSFVITGAANGIGAATARVATANGAKVVIADVDSERGNALANEISGSGGRAIFSQCDVTDADQVTATMALAVETFGSLDVLHNNAGIADRALAEGAELSLDGLDLDVWDRVMAINLRGPFLCAKAAVPHLRRSSNASIINAVSIAACVARPSTLAYGASKGGLVQLTKGLALELAADRIRVNAYAPGIVETELASQFLNMSGDPTAALSNVLDNYLSPTMGQPADVAHLVCFLASPQAAFVNGAVWLIDGGMLAWRGTRDERVVDLASRKSSR